MQCWRYTVAARRVGFENPRMLLADINMTISRLGPQSGDMLQKLEGAEAFSPKNFPTAIGSLTL